ncbi:hypothetical protein V5F32_00685 [Xanthobacter oligotrophicus]|uniref:Uncharacterized protein n=1 Tax=Xanthobacter oligotrophicus TaxID=2607286 RepID=A0ABW6ZQD6_9HYPH
MTANWSPLDIIASGAEALPCVRRATNWNERRVYVTLAAPPSRANGDRNLKIYFDGASKAWVIEPYKGYLSDGMIAALNTFCAHYNIHA